MLTLLHASGSISEGTKEAAGQDAEWSSPVPPGLSKHLQCLTRHRWPEMSKPDPRTLPHPTPDPLVPGPGRSSLGGAGCWAECGRGWCSVP